MIKTNKIFILFLILILAVSMAACGGSKDDSDIAASDDTQSAEAMDSLIQWMEGGTFSYDFKMIMEYEGTTTEATGSMAMDNGNYAMSTETEVDGNAVKARTIIIDDKMYVIDDANKLIISMTSVSADMTGGMPTDYADMEKIDSGKGEVDGKTLPYDEYTIEGYKVKYYMDGDNVYAIESEAEGAKSTMIITNAKKSVSKDVFELPEGYQEMSM